MKNKFLYLYMCLLASATFLLIVAGGLVTSTQSGLSVPDWPLSYGQWMPPMVGGIKYEHGHRMIASLIGFMTLVLVIWTGFSESRKWVRWMALAALGAVVLQGILGGLTVLFLLPAPISIFHACLAQTFFTLTVCLAYFMSREWMEGRGTPLWVPNASISGRAQGPAPTDILKPLMILIILVYLQLILGATIRHTANQYVVISHVVNAFLILIHAIVVMLKTNKQNLFIGEGIFLGVTGLLQTALGMGSFIYSVMLPQTLQPSWAKILFLTAHQSLGALLLATSVFLFLRIKKCLLISH